MSIRLRFTITLTFLGVVLFGTYALLAYRGERNDLRTATEREIRIIGRSLATSIGHALRDRQRKDILATLDTLDALDPEVDIHVHETDGRPIAHSQGAAIDDEVEHLVARAATTQTEMVSFLPDGDPTRLVFAAPVSDGEGTLLGSMAIVRPVSDLNADLERTKWRLIAVVASFVAVMLVAGLVLGTIYVTRPVGAVLAGVRNVRQGDFRSPVRATHQDEIGALVAEFNSMLDALTQARAALELEVEARVRLEQGLQHADKMITIGQLSAGLAHEIGSPLQVMTGRASALVDHPDPEVQRKAKILVEQSERIARIVEQLLSYGRRRPPTITTCDLVDPVRRVIDLLSGEAQRRKVALELTTDDRDHKIEADPDQVQQVAINLVKNALAATAGGGKIAVRVTESGDHVRLAVTDTGTGMSDDVQSRLFEPFFTTRAAEGGTGLGLAVVRAITDEHGGTIEVNSAAGRGAEFIASFPHRQKEHRHG